MTKRAWSKTPGFRALSSLIAGERAARYTLLEGVLRERRVLEIGTDDGQSLVRLHAAGARQVVGTTADPARVRDPKARPSAVDWVLMEPGRADFPDRSFDVALVVDLARELEAQPRFLEELRRVLSPDGFGLLTVRGRGAALGGLFGAEHSVEIHPERFVRDCRRVFDQVRVLAQVPFVGVGIQPADHPPDGLELTWEPSFAGRPAEPSHLNILVGAPAPALNERTLVELPYADLCTVADAQGVGAKGRLAQELDEAYSLLSEKEAALAHMAERLPRLRAALESRLESPRLMDGADEIVAPTVLDRPLPDEPSATRMEELTEALERSEHARRSAERRVSELAEQSDLMERMLQAQAADTTIIEARTEVTVTTSEPTAAEPSEETPSSVYGLWDTRIDPGLSPEIRRAEAEIAELRQELAERLAVAESVRVERDEMVRGLEAQLYAVTGKLREQERSREGLVDRLADAERFTATADRARRQLESERDELARQLDREQRAHAESAERAELLEFELHARTRDLEALQAALRERDEVLEHVQGFRAATTADRRAVEIAASHLSREVEALRARAQALRNERDTLATASRMLADERDAALALAKRGASLEKRLEEVLADREVIEDRADAAEARLAEAEDRATELERRVVDAEEARRTAESDRASLRRELDRNRASLDAERGQRAGMDQGMARLQVAAVEAAQAGQVAEDRSRALEGQLMDAVRGAREARVDAERMQAQLLAKQDEVFARNQELLEVAAARAHEEKARLQDKALVTELRGRAALATAQIAKLQKALLAARSVRVKDSDTAEEAVRREKARTARAMHALEEDQRAARAEAAALRDRVDELEAELADTRRGLAGDQGDRIQETFEDHRLALFAARGARDVQREESRQVRLRALSEEDMRTLDGLRLERALEKVHDLEEDRAELRRALREAVGAERPFEQDGASRDERHDDAAAAASEVSVGLRSNDRASPEAQMLADELEVLRILRDEASRERAEARARVVELEAQLAAAGSGTEARRPEAPERVPPSAPASGPLDEADTQDTEFPAVPTRSIVSKSGLQLDLEKAREDLTRRLERIQEREAGLIRAQRALEDARAEVEVLGQRRSSSGEVEEMRRTLDAREREITRLEAAAKVLQGERARLRGVVQTAREGRVRREQRIAELESALVERSRRLDFVSKELADKTIQLRQITGRSK